MKNFRSSKNLKIMDSCTRQQSQLRVKIKMLQQQVQVLQKSNLNIFIPLSEHETKQLPNYESINNKLKTQILNLQQEIQRCKTTIKKLETQKEMQKIAFQNQIQKIKQEMALLQVENKQIRQQNQSLSEKFIEEEAKRMQKEKEAIQLRVQNKFIKEDLIAERKRKENIEKKYQEINSFVMAVNFNSRIYRSKEIMITAIETQQLKNIKAYTEELQRKIKDLINANKQQKIYLCFRKQNLGQQIVRLKQNIDLQLGLSLSSQTTKSFLTAYNEANSKFTQLLTSCKLKQ